MFIYRSHLGNGLYISEDSLSEESLYCETCGDGDVELGEVNNKEQFWELFEDGSYNKEYLESFFKKCFLEKEGE